MRSAVTATMLYNFVQCPHRVTLDLYEDPAKRDPESRFLMLLWERGTMFEQEVIRNLALPFTDLGGITAEERERLTTEAMERGEGMIYAARIRAGKLLGEPDLLRREGSGYTAGDIKSGAGEEGATDDTEGKPKKHYAVQLGLYTDILERTGRSSGRRPFVWDIHGKEVFYDLGASPGTRGGETLWMIYQEILGQTEKILSGAECTRPGLVSACKICHWRSLCFARMTELDDLTLIPEVGRARRDSMLAYFQTVSELAQTDVGRLIRGKKSAIPRVGSETLRKFQARARLLKDPKARPYLKQRFSFPEAERELFFDIETDPFRDLCYLHGFVERRLRDMSTERYVPFIAENSTPKEERRAFAEALEFVQSSKPCVLYYYSSYERRWWRTLQERYPEVATQDELDQLFDDGSAVDLYTKVVLPFTEWPTHDYSIKTLAKHLGFGWRDPSPSGAESVEWYHRWIEGGDPAVRKRILAYNEDDCRAMRVLLEAIRRMPLRSDV